jgi:rfaE bifunctional protein nucleotidyltransferase chain/domain
MQKTRSFKSVCRLAHLAQKQGKKVVFVHGIFDILHRGHVELLTRAKKLGDILVVGVDCDENAKDLKGLSRPINGQKARMFVLSHIDSVDYIFLIPHFFKNKETFYCSIIYKSLMPDIVSSCIEAGTYGLLKKQNAEKLGIKFINIKKGLYNIRTSQVIKELKLD